MRVSLARPPTLRPLRVSLKARQMVQVVQRLVQARHSPSLPDRLAGEVMSSPVRAVAREAQAHANEPMAMSVDNVADHATSPGVGQLSVADVVATKGSRRRE